MKAGFAEIVITPPDGKCFIAGYGPGVESTGVHDDLYASAVYFEDGDRRAVLVSYDIIGYDAHPYRKLKDSIAKAAGIAEDCVFLTCTHTHEGPDNRKFVRGEPNPGYSEEYTDFLADRSAEVVKLAVSQPREFNLGVNRSYVDENMNRRLFLNEEYRYPSRSVDLLPIAHIYAHADKELGMLYFFPTEGEYTFLWGKGDWHPFGAIANYSMHPLTAGRVSRLISADVPGVLRKLVRESLECPLCYITGAAGDNHPKSPNTGFEETRRVGGILGSEIIQRCSDAFMVPEPLGLKCGSYSVTLNYVTPEEYEAIPVTESSRERKEFHRPGEPVEVEYTLLAIGPVLFIGVPGELVSELGSVLKWFSPFKRTYIMYNATPNFGYISHPNAYEWGGYEPSSTRLSPKSVRPLINHILDSMENL